jgi:hypothetical protein
MLKNYDIHEHFGEKTIGESKCDYLFNVNNKIV